jgi:hypothetical protein
MRLVDAGETMTAMFRRDGEIDVNDQPSELSEPETTCASTMTAPEYTPTSNNIMKPGQSVQLRSVMFSMIRVVQRKMT